MPSYAFIGGVDVSRACLLAACETGAPPSVVVGYDESRSGAAGYVDLEPLCSTVGAPLLRTRDVNDASVIDALRHAAPDIIFVIGWSQLVHVEILGIPRFGCVGIHPTPLPVGRGRAPIPWTILRGCRRTASTMFFLTPGVDDGDIVGQLPFDVDEREDAGTLYAKHRAAHESLIREHLSTLLSGTALRQAQDESKATYWEARQPSDGRIPPQASVEQADRLVRAVTRPFPGAFVTRTDGSRLTIWRARPTEAVLASPGTLVESEDGLVLSCTDGGLLVLEAEAA